MAAYLGHKAQDDASWVLEIHEGKGVFRVTTDLKTRTVTN